jgi:hypothetical protein
MHTFTDLHCTCCASAATVTMDGETFHHGNCPKCGTLLTLDNETHAELARRIRNGDHGNTDGRV